MPGWVCDAYSGRVQTTAVRFAEVAARIERKCRDHGSPTPWWIPVMADTMLVAATVGGLASRELLLDPRALLFAPVLLLLVAMYRIERWVPNVVLVAATLVPVALLMHEPLGELAPLDGFGGTLALVIAIVTVTDGWRLAVPTTIAAAAILVTQTPDSLQAIVSAHDLVIGIVVGVMFRWLSRALEAEQADRAGQVARATLAERQRIAAEVHDLVAHSLSVTMLHLNGARQTLSDGDVDEARAALDDAEAVGREAMADIRRTVGALREGESDSAPLPTAADIPALVERYRGAGLPIQFVQTGQPDGLSSSSGLGMFRVAQEALANVAKHAPGVPAQVTLDFGPHELRLEVRNAYRPSARGEGSGLHGMQTRASQLAGNLSAGPVGDEWVVDLRLPAREGVGR